MGRRGRGGEIRRLRTRDRLHRSDATPAPDAPQPGEARLWFDPSLRTAAELLAQRAPREEDRDVA